MKASAIGGSQQQTPPVTAGKAKGRQGSPHPDGPQGVARGQQAAAGNEQDTTIDPVAESSADRAKGVLRLLQEGHFRGVADVRLRINFHEELVALQNEAVRSVAPGGLQSISDAVNAQIDALIDSGTLTQEQQAAVVELRQTFSDTVKQLTDEFAGAEGAESDALAAGLQEAFDAFLASLTSLLVPEEPPAPPVGEQPDPPSPPEEPSEPAPDAVDVEPPTEDPTGETPEVPPESTPEPTPPQDPQEPPASPFDVGAFLGELTNAFDVALAELVETLRTTQVLPELSPPNGNGQAYDKFLAIYNELWGVNQPSQTPPNEPLDTVA